MNAEGEATLLGERRPTAMSRNRGLRLASMPAPADTVELGSGFGVAVVSGPRRTVIRPMGELDVTTAGLLETAVVDVLESGAREIVLDLRGLAFCDAAGLQVFVRMRRRATQSGRRLWLERPTGTVCRVLDLCELRWLAT